MNERFLAVDAASVKSIVADLKAKYPELEEDSGLFADVLEGETNLFELIDQALDLKLDADEMADAIKARVDGLQVRRKRFEDKSDAMKSIIQQLMAVANQRKITRPVATISLTAARTNTVVSDVAELPQGFFKLERKADIQAITAALSAGETVPGAATVTGKQGLMIRTK